MNRGIRRLRRINDLHSTHNISSEGKTETEDYSKGTLKNKYPITNTIQPTLAQRIVHLENELANVNASLTNYINELNEYKKRVAVLEKLVGELTISRSSSNGKHAKMCQSYPSGLHSGYTEKIKSQNCSNINPNSLHSSFVLPLCTHNKMHNEYYEEKIDVSSDDGIKKISLQNNDNLTLNSCSNCEQKYSDQLCSANITHKEKESRIKECECYNSYSKNFPIKLESLYDSNFNIKDYGYDNMRLKHENTKIHEKLQKNENQDNLNINVEHVVPPERLELLNEPNPNAKIMSGSNNDFQRELQVQTSSHEISSGKETVETIRTLRGNISVEKDVTLINQVPGINRNSKVLWTIRIAGTNADQGSNIAIDMDNNIIIGGIYIGEEGSQTIIPSIVTFYHSDGTQGKILNSFSGTNLFIVKYDPFGVVLWIARITNVASDNGFGITTNSNNDIIVIGSYRKQNEIYDSNNQLVSTLPVDGILNTFIIKYDCSGNVVWSLNITAPNDGIVEGLSIASDINSNIYITGYYKASYIKFHNSNKTIGVSIPGRNGENAFLVKYDANGFFQWIAQITGEGQERSLDVATGPNNEVVITGFYKSSQINIFNGSPNEPSLATTLTNHRNPSTLGEQEVFENETSDAFIVKYDGVTGKVFWATNISGPKSEKGNGISVDQMGNIVVTGSCSSNPTFVYNANDGTQSIAIRNEGMDDAFVVKYDQNGIVLWTAKIVGDNLEQGVSVATDLNNNIVVTGQYSSNVITIYGANDYIGPKLSNATGLSNAFIIKYDPNGMPIWASKIENVGIGSSLRVAIDGDNNIVSTGFYNDKPVNIHNSDGSIGGIQKSSGKLLSPYDKILKDSKNPSLFVGSDIFVVKYIEYLQTLTLPPALCPTMTKRITLNSYGGSNTLISVFQNGMADGSNRNISDILLTNIGSTITLVWEDNRWNIVYFREVVPIYN
ncbi:MAG: hypothetical protein QXW79_01305 [Thermoplasmata archaeon]